MLGVSCFRSLGEAVAPSTSLTCQVKGGSGDRRDLVPSRNDYFLLQLFIFPHKDFAIWKIKKTRWKEMSLGETNEEEGERESGKVWGGGRTSGRGGGLGIL